MQYKAALVAIAGVPDELNQLNAQAGVKVVYVLEAPNEQGVVNYLLIVWTVPG